MHSTNLGTFKLIALNLKQADCCLTHRDLEEGTKNTVWVSEEQHFVSIYLHS